jgi:hypothetical protein
MLDLGHNGLSLGLGWQAWGTLTCGDAPTLTLILWHRNDGVR